MANRRTYGSYDDGCASAHALDLIGERWALIVVRELILRPKRFADLQHDIPGIGPGVLSRRLHDLEENGIVLRRTLPRPAAVTVYDLTEWGRALEEVNAALSRWAVRSPSLPLDADMSPDTLVLAMRAHARPAPPNAPESTVGLTLTRDGEPAHYLATVTPTGTTIEATTIQPTATPDAATTIQPGATPDAAATIPAGVRVGGAWVPAGMTMEAAAVPAGVRGDAAAIPAGVDAWVEASTKSWKSLVVAGADLSAADVVIAGDKGAVRSLLAATRL
ncbi:winged helix-turn-helix transcriptional regulator [Actinoplanes sp. NPDC023714]|uniref:winged helix-turn-helix transcriptional regulator n=1 Tax=Actinoplanes sp. NPDC023714 TaxID=3154322 RepID=UPI00340C1363